ncbi:MAG: hypothetical protein M3Z23_11255 [Acidobacteriota bacterium]|nr:hypothetical protein [Acidobacteriota bacterium]
MADDLDAGTPARGPGTIPFYVTQGFVNAFKQFSNRSELGDMGDAVADPRGFVVKQFRDWEPLRGYRPNRLRIVALYDYYRDTYLKGKRLFGSDKLLWTGLGRMAGGAIVGGLDLLRDRGQDVTPLTPDQVDSLSGAQEAKRRENPVIGFLEIGKAIFLDLIWQHEAFLDEPRIALDLAQKYDANPDITAFDNRIVFRPETKKNMTKARVNSYLTAWQQIISNNLDSIASGNKALLQNEQFNLVQPFYDKMIKDGSVFRDASPFTSRIHPYHRDFIESKPGGNVLTRDDRWAWITEPGGMYAKWAESISPTIRMTTVVRQHLVETPLDVSIRHQWVVEDHNLESGAP